MKDTFLIAERSRQAAGRGMAYKALRMILSEELSINPN